MRGLGKLPVEGKRKKFFFEHLKRKACSHKRVPVLRYGRERGAYCPPICCWGYNSKATVKTRAQPEKEQKKRKDGGPTGSCREPHRRAAKNNASEKYGNCKDGEKRGTAREIMGGEQRPMNWRHGGTLALASKPGQQAEGGLPKSVQ